MVPAFQNQIRLALFNPRLQAALDANADRRIASRQQAFASLEVDLSVARKQAKAVRSLVISNLEEYLQEFIHSVSANGIIVHLAADGVEAVQIVLEIARKNNARLIAKSKTMVSEEIGLNQSLENAELEVVETDLGEYIVQLRGERPAHIITPAVHLTRADVGVTFAEKLGMPYTEDVTTMTAAARQVLRQIFLEADIGISGVNLGVVETGTLCLVTNEGNGRMVTTLPRVHIALMGIERLVPTMQDLALMLNLLPRSATGQKLSVYTSLIRSPRQPDEVDGAEQRHLILVDNGRRRIRDSSLVEILNCIRCGACLNACPVFREIGGHAYVDKSGESSPYPGPMGSIVSPGLFGEAEFSHLARASSLCGACQEACPVDIDLPKLLLRLRAGETYLGAGRQPPRIPLALNGGLRQFGWLALSARNFIWAQKLLGTASQLLSLKSRWLRLPAFTGWGTIRDFPSPARKTFHSRWKSLHSEIETKENKLPHNPNQSQDKALEPIEKMRISRPISLVDRFSTELQNLGGTVITCRQEDLRPLVLELLETKNITSMIAWVADCLPERLVEHLINAGIRISHTPDPDAQAGLTGAQAAIAETGTLVLTSRVGQPLTASLLPETHIAILNAKDIYTDLYQVLNLPQLQSAASTVLITGPSRTADIEMTLTIGVHGPREVHVFIIRGD